MYDPIPGSTQIKMGNSGKNCRENMAFLSYIRKSHTEFWGNLVFLKQKHPFSTRMSETHTPNEWHLIISPILQPYTLTPAISVAIMKSVCSKLVFIAGAVK